MLINLPNKMIASMIGRELMKYFAVKNEKTGKFEVLVCMGDIDPNSVSVPLKYYQIDPNEDFLKYFDDKKEITEDGKQISLSQGHISRELINDFLTGNVDQRTINDYAKLVVALDNYVNSNTSSIGTYISPFKIVENVPEVKS